MDNLDKLLEKLKVSTLKFEESTKTNFLGEERRVVNLFVPKARDNEEFVVNESNRLLPYLIDSEFENYRFIKGFEAIWSEPLKCIECGITVDSVISRNLLKTIDKLLNPSENIDIDELQEQLSEDRNGGDKELKRIIIANIKGIEISIGFCTKEYAVFRALKLRTTFVERIMEREYTLQIKNTDVKNHDEAMMRLLKISNSLFFHLTFYLDVSFNIKTARERRIRKVIEDETLGIFGSTVFKYEYDNEAVSLFLHGKNTNELPLYQFLSFYQTIEYYFTIFSNKEAKIKVKRVLKNPKFDPNNEMDLSKVISLIQTSRSGEIGDERSQLKATVKNCIDSEMLREFIFNNQDIYNYFKGKDSKKISSCNINITSKNSDIIEEVCERLYDIRCKIVHKKANGGDGQVILPYSLEIINLKNDIKLLEFIAKQVLLENSKKFEVE
ncbi:hypothetical protein ABE042_12565 [Viridibacillus arvi]|uniref:hypothetical protein n=1 Tax=Viridibacillus arvi TaxID=263475 RepID=UPI003D2DB032